MTSVAATDIEVWDEAQQPCRMRKKAVRQGRSERRDESYSAPYVEPLSEARTPLAVFFRILLDPQLFRQPYFRLINDFLQAGKARESESID